MRIKFTLAAAAAILSLAACDQPVSPTHTSAKSLDGALTSNIEVTNAVYTITNYAVDGENTCENGPVGQDPQNCNIYMNKRFVWVGGESLHGNGNGLPNGTYVFAVLQPSGQQDPNDGVEQNLSDLAPTTNTGAGDAYTNRVFTLTNGVIGYNGTHDFDATRNRIRLFPYDDTPNPGGEYIMAVCALVTDGEGHESVSPNVCKYDAFKVKVAEPPPPEALPLSASKTAAGAYTNRYEWTIAKAVDKTVVKQVGGTAVFNYTVTVTHDGGSISGVNVAGSIVLNNPNTAPVAITGVSDQLSDGTVCSVADVPAWLVPGETALTYQCSLAALPSEVLNNRVTVTWAEQTLDNRAHLAAGSADATVEGIAFAENLVDGSVNVTDTFAGTLGTLTRDDASPATFTYARSIAVVANVCNTYDNTATYTTSTSATTGSASQSVMVCGNVAGGLTIGFWQNKNGQAIITSGTATAGVCSSGAWLRQYTPFQDLSATATCANVASYAMGIIKAANASGSSMNAMLKAQMLATALDVFFSTPSLGGNRINAPAPLGGIKVDLALICTSIASCSSTYGDASAAFGGATAMTVEQLLEYAAGQSNVGGSLWYGQVKAIQELAKNTFDAINNQVALVSP